MLRLYLKRLSTFQQKAFWCQLCVELISLKSAEPTGLYKGNATCCVSMVMALPDPDTARKILTAALPLPVLFHPLKHHLGYIKAFIQAQVTSSGTDTSIALRSIGQSQLDFYTGNMLPQQIAEEVILCLQQHNLLQPEAYLTYLADQGSHYRTITLSDSTDWVLRWGVIPGRYVHLHPARYAARTIRVKAVSLKTAIATIVTAQQQNLPIDLPLVNKVRAEQLNLPPLTVLHKAEGAGKLISLLQQH